MGGGNSKEEMLKKKVLEKMKKVIDNVNEIKFEIYFNIRDVNVPSEVGDEIIYEAVSDLIKRQEFKEFLEKLREEIETEKFWYKSYELDYVFEGILEFSIDYYLGDFYIKVEAYDLILKAGKMPMKSKKHIAGVSEILPISDMFLLDENVKKKLAVYSV